MPISRQVITFLSIVASGIDNPMMAIIKAIAVPSGIPFATNIRTTNFSCNKFTFLYKKSEESSKNERVDLENLKRFANFDRKLRVV